MADRGVFVASFLTVVLLVAGAFAVPEFFIYELLTATIFVVVAVLVYFGQDEFPYMLGIIAPIVWFVFKILVGELSRDVAVMFRYLGHRPLAPLDTPLKGFALLTALLLLAVSARAWRKDVTEKFIGKTFWTALIISLVWVGVLGVWEFHMASLGTLQH